MVIRRAGRLCPIFRSDKDRVIDLPTGSNNALAGTVEVTLGVVASPDGGTATTDVTIAGLRTGEAVLATPNASLPTYAQFNSAKITADDTLTFEFHNSTGSAVGGQVRTFLWRRINTV